MYVHEADEDKLELIYCTHCGSPMGRLGDGSRCGLICPRCKEEFVFSLKEGAVLQKRTQRIGRREALKV